MTDRVGVPNRSGLEPQERVIVTAVSIFLRRLMVVILTNALAVQVIFRPPFSKGVERHDQCLNLILPLAVEK